MAGSRSANRGNGSTANAFEVGPITALGSSGLIAPISADDLRRRSCSVECASVFSDAMHWATDVRIRFARERQERYSVNGSMQILLVEDDQQIAERVARDLGRSGYDVIDVTTTEAAYDALASRPIEAVVLDRLLGDNDAITALADWRRAGLKTPVLVVSSLGGVADRIAGLAAGADDYLAKPFHTEELDARLKALLRARDRHAQGEADILLCGSIRVDRRNRAATRNGTQLMLQPREYRLLEALASSPGQVVPRSVLLEKVWNLTFDPRTKIIETHVSRLRDKLDLAGTGEAIETIRGIGYRLRDDA
jgi:two-component system OmpR family response regulator